jgi:uncharacterized protein
MAQPPVVIKLTSEQGSQIEQVSGKKVRELGIEATEGEGWLFVNGSNKSWLLKNPNPEAYADLRRKLHPSIDPRYARFRLRVGKSRIHRVGIFAEERIPARRNVIEYIGELINPIEAYRRSNFASENYTFALDKFWRIDGAVGGSGAEFINHSCDPNLRWSRVPGGRIFCQSARPIQDGEELTLDYGFPRQAPKVSCRCGSPKCRGTINLIRVKRRGFRSRNGWTRHRRKVS